MEKMKHLVSMLSDGVKLLPSRVVNAAFHNFDEAIACFIKCHRNKVTRNEFISVCIFGDDKGPMV